MAKILTEKQKRFCQEYVRNFGDGTKAYLSAYDSESETSAKIEACRLLRRDDITEYIQALTKPTENKIQNEREKKRAIIWEGIEQCRANGDHSGVARYMDILNKMDAEYININRNIEERETAIDQLDTDTLKRLVGA